MDATQKRWKEIHGPLQGPLFVRDEEAQPPGSLGAREGERSHGRPAAEGVELPEGLEGRKLLEVRTLTW